MKETKWTEGPWRVDPKRSLRVVAGEDITIASTGTADSIRRSWSDNATLIAAAPELYDALKTFVDGNIACSPRMKQVKGHMAGCRVCRGHEALAKARGEQP